MITVALLAYTNAVFRIRETRRLARARAARSVGGFPSYLRVVEVEGGAPPQWLGEPPHHETPGGMVVRYPSAYRRKALSTYLVYCPSTQRVEVGRDWDGFLGL